MNEKVDVLIIGCGPTGAVLGNLLAKSGLRTLIIEKDNTVFPIPRATHIDEETLRNFQLTGLMEQLLPHVSPFGFMDVIDSGGKQLLEQEIFQEDALHGYSNSCFFDQPAFERVLREGLKQYKNVTFFANTSVTSFKEEFDFVAVGAINGNGDKLNFEASWVIGCDGGKSIVREWKNIKMKSYAPKRDWFIVDTLLKDEKDSALLPDRFRYILNADRLTIYAHGFGLNRRWEFQLSEDEDSPTETQAMSWISEFIAPNKLKVIRMAKYAHHSLVAEKYKEGRFLLAGDAAHMMPPSAGQGMCSGIRDAVNLAWKLAEVVKNNASISLLDSYETERKPHVIDILKGSLFISNRLNADTHWSKQWRKIQLTLIGNLPPLQAILKSLATRKNPLYDGFMNEMNSISGRHFPQLKAKVMGESLNSDDCLGYNFNIVASSKILSLHNFETAQALNLSVFCKQPTYHLFQEGIEQWLNQNGLDFVLVRPDKIVYGGGKIKDFDAVIEGWKKALNPKLPEMMVKVFVN